MSDPVPCRRLVFPTIAFAGLAALAVGCASPAAPSGLGFEPGDQAELGGPVISAQRGATVQDAALSGAFVVDGANVQERLDDFVGRYADKAPAGELRAIREVRAEGTGRSVVRAQQIIDGIQVDGAQLLVTFQGDEVSSVKGSFVESKPADTVQVDEPEAFAVAASYTGLDQAVADGIAQVDSRLVIRVLPDRAVYAWRIAFETMLSKPIVYVDAVGGQVLFELNDVHHLTGTGTLSAIDGGSPTTGTFGIQAVTSGRGKNKVTQYILNSLETPAAEVHSYQANLCQGGLNVCGDEIVSATTDFSGIDSRYTTGHAHVEAVMAFLATKGLNSYDDNGGRIRVFTFADGNDYDNASYGGSDYILLGDGTYDAATGTGYFQPLVASGVVFHEMGHGVDGQAGPNLEYQFESGALSESWADMQAYAGRAWFEGTTGNAHTLGGDFTPGNWHNEEACGDDDVAPASNTDCGPCVSPAVDGDGICSENEVCIGAGAPAPAVESADCGTCTFGPPVNGDGVCDRGWDIRGDYHHAYIRNLREPKQVHQPDTYQGDDWVPVVGCTPDPNTNDNCGVHTNSGVGNEWFALLAEGGSGTNDNGLGFSITGIGAQPAYDIALRTLRNHVTSTATYQDWADGTVVAAIEIYGDGAPEVGTVVDAWDAVGINAFVPAPPVCGDGTCDSGEACDSCAADCGACPTCGDGTCDASEDCSTCESDCGACPTCDLGQLGDSCSTDSECCSGACKGRPGAKTCK